MLIGLRELQHETKHGRAEAWVYGIARRLLERPWLYRLALRLARLTMRPMARGEWLRKLPGPGHGWTDTRDFPAPARKSFREHWGELS